MQKTFAYLRVSGRGQVSGDGFPRQQKAVREYARQHEFRIVETFEERGVTGARETYGQAGLASVNGGGAAC